MTKTIDYTPQGVCTRRINITVTDGKIEDVTFTGGCSGNTQGVSILVKGLAVEDAIEKLGGIDCKGKGTSCPDQLAQALKQAL